MEPAETEENVGEVPNFDGFGLWVGFSDECHSWKLVAGE
jgi:hypothetical protein